MKKILPKNSLSSWVKTLSDYRIIAPRHEGDRWFFGDLDDPDTLTFEYPNTVLSPKEHLFPQREVFLEFQHPTGSEPKVTELLPEDSPTIVMGVRSCDARAIALMDKVFSGDYIDPYYWKRRHQTVLVGVACNEPVSDACFCTAVDGAPHSTEGLDVLFTVMGESYFIESITDKGDQILAIDGDLFTNPTKNDEKRVEKMRSDALKGFDHVIDDSDRIPAVLENLFDSSFWAEESLSCIRCGICTYLCPSCHCFDITDEVIQSFPLKGARIRTWDTCQFPDFTMHSSGHNPRPDKAARLRQRIQHKFRYSQETLGSFLCTGCGRCVEQCPVGIDIVEILNKASRYDG